MRYFAQRGCTVWGVDRAAEALASASVWGEAVQADIENGPWPFGPRRFNALVVTNYLWRPLVPTLLASLAPGGVLIYETFALGQHKLGKPSRPEFLLQPGELLSACAALQVVAFEQGLAESPARVVQRIVAVQPPASSEALPYPLAG